MIKKLCVQKPKLILKVTKIFNLSYALSIVLVILITDSQQTGLNMVLLGTIIAGLECYLGEQIMYNK